MSGSPTLLFFLIFSKNKISFRKRKKFQSSRARARRVLGVVGETAQRPVRSWQSDCKIVVDQSRFNRAWSDCNLNPNRSNPAIGSGIGMRVLIRVWISCPPSGPLFLNPAFVIRFISHEFAPNSNCIVNAFEFSANSYGLLVFVQARSSNAVGYPSRGTHRFNACPNGPWCNGILSELH